ncbi:MAG: hypothetical protein EKK42_27025 [Pseudonocardiaceae bacterium]|nr:MAG: hypothetical protein EKK42_27025 [Pseudonocardiaceae bacterium]
MKYTSHNTTPRKMKAPSDRLHRKLMASDKDYATRWNTQRNPRVLCSTDEYFQRNPEAPCRIVASGPFAGRFWNFTFYPRKGIGQTIHGENLRIILAERFSTGTPLARMQAVFEWMKAEGCFPKMAR